MGPRILDGLGAKARGIGAEPSPGGMQFGREPLAVPDEARGSAGHAGTRQSGRSAALIVRMSRRMSSGVGRPQYQ